MENAKHTCPQDNSEALLHVLKEPIWALKEGIRAWLVHTYIYRTKKLLSNGKLWTSFHWICLFAQAKHKCLPNAHRHFIVHKCLWTVPCAFVLWRFRHFALFSVLAVPQMPCGCVGNLQAFCWQFFCKCLTGCTI